ncbi:S-layer homology domain-containing protein [Acidaminococcus massiliensis]|uniref:S-layer homology domain-containing protein n=1 Tax=Acidaminococcus massiliensis TaxID=1852375 RepID=UPI003521CC8B
MAWAADTTTGAGNGVAIGTSSNAPKVENVAIGKGAGISYSNGASNATGDIVVGNGANINNYASQGGSVAIGKNAKVENMAGGGEASFAFGQTTFSGGWWSSARIPADPTKVVGSVAIGDNTFARTGSTMIGSHNYKGALGDTTVDSASTRTDALNVYATTIGANSFSNGAFTTSTGVYNIISSDYNGGRLANPVKNLGATINGSLNSIEGRSGNYYSGIANTVSGVANRTFNSNGSLIYGAGNEITNSVTSLSSVPTDSGSSAKDFAEKLRTAITSSESGGATLAIGGGNKADYTQKTSIIGVNNTITGTSGKVSQLNFVSGFKNTITNASNNIVMGDKHTVTADNTVAIGGLSSADTRSVANTTSVGYDTKVNKEGGVALGYKSNATVDKGATGYDLSVNGASSETNSTWKSTAAAVSVGDVANNITRQITSVAAGTNDTDAVNVAQLKKAVAGASDGNDTLVGSTDGLSLSGNTLSMTVKDTAGNEVKGSVDLSSIAGSTDTRNNVTAGENVKIDETPNADGSSTYKINVKADGKVESGNTSIVTGGTVYNETHPTTNGTYISKDKSAGENLTALDNQVKTNADSISRMGNSIDKLGNRINRVGAGAAALAALHPQDFDPDDKWDFAAGYGNYKSAHAVAVGAFYRPTEDTMLSVGGSFGGGENMINAGVTFKLGQHNHVSRSRVAIAKEVLALRQDNQELRNEVNELKNMLKQGRTSDIKNVSFPDVPKDHWAYNYVKSLADRGYVTGYPDGEFKGDRSLTRYEYAAIIYRALQNGAPSDADMAKAVNEFGPELEQVQNIERFRVDRISGKDNDRHKVERVRINDKDNKAKNDFRDVYGTSIQNKAH